MEYRVGNFDTARPFLLSSDRGARRELMYQDSSVVDPVDE